MILAILLCPTSLAPVPEHHHVLQLWQTVPEIHPHSLTTGSLSLHMLFLLLRVSFIIFSTCPTLYATFKTQLKGSPLYSGFP